MFPSQTYQHRRSELKKIPSGGILLFLGNDESPMNYTDNTYHFRQDSTFLYFFGMDFPGLAAVIDLDENREILFGNDLTIDDIVWMGTQPTLATRGSAYGLTDVRTYTQLKGYLNKALLGGRKIHFLPAYRIENKIRLWQLLGVNPDETVLKSSEELIKAVVDLRNHKTDEEIREIEKAIDLSVDMHVTAMKMARPGIPESALSAAVTAVALASGGELAFPVIMTINGQTLHNHYHGNILRPGQMVLSDCGAETAMHYCGDLSSTFPVDRTFTTRQKEIYQISLDSHQAALDTLAPGAPFLNVHYSACRTIINGLKQIGLMTGDTEEALAAGAHAMFFPCGTGHMMGLDVHDMENLGEVYVGYAGEPKSAQFGLKSLRLARPMEPGFVSTIEPGIYFIPELIDLWRKEGRNAEYINFDKVEEYKGFSGIRNEENIVITGDGYRILGKPKPKSIAEVEALRC